MKATLATQFDTYLSFCRHTKGLRRCTIDGYADVFEHFRRLMPEITYVQQLTFETIDIFFARLQQRRRSVGHGQTVQGVKASTVRTYGSKLHSFFDWLCVRGQLTSNPVNRSQLPQPDYSDKRALERGEIEKILAAIVQHSTNHFLLKRDLAMVHTLLFAGLRKTELLALRVSDIDLAKRVLTVRGTTSKSKFTRHIPLSASVLLHVEDYLAERRRRGCRSEYLWLSNRADSRLTEHGLKHWVDALKERSGVRFHVHRFRHSFACMLGRSNVSAIKIQKLLGHTDLRMTQTYLRSMGVEDVRDSVQLLTLENL